MCEHTPHTGGLDCFLSRSGSQCPPQIGTSKMLPASATRNTAVIILLLASVYFIARVQVGEHSDEGLRSALRTDGAACAVTSAGASAPFAVDGTSNGAANGASAVPSVHPSSAAPSFLHPSNELTAEYPRLAAALRTIDSADLRDLVRLDFLVPLICGIGLNHDNRPGLYGEVAARCVAEGRGLWQLPVEFSSLLILFRSVSVHRFMDVGPLYGFTSCLFAAFLRRFVPSIHIESVDFFVEWAHPEFAMATLPITYAAPRTTADYESQPAFDAVFIDGNHDFDFAMADYTRIGAHAKITAFHDCYDEFMDPLPGGGVPKVWLALRAKYAGNLKYRLYEFRAHPEKRHFGICAIVRLDLAPEFDAAAFEKLVPAL